MVFKPTEKRAVCFDDSHTTLSAANLAYFSKMLSIPLVADYNFDTRKQLDELGVPLGLFWVDPKADPSINEKAIEIIRRL